MPLGRHSREAVAFVRDQFAEGVVGATRRAHERCPLCSGAEAFRIAEKDRHGLPLPVQICGGCGLVYSAVYMTPAFAARYYAESASILKMEGRGADEMFVARTAPGAYAWRRHAYVRAHLGEAAYERLHRVAEIGCGDGCNLVPFACDGRSVIGCDYDDVRLATGRRAGLELVVGGSQAMIGRGPAADLVIVSHVLEHFGDIDAAFAEVRSLLAPGGVVYVEVPGIGLVRPRSDAVELDGYRSSHDLLGYLQFEHAYHFSLATLTRFAERAGLRRLAGDEAARALFVADASATSEPLADGPGASGLLADLAAAERSYLSPANAPRRWLRRPYLQLRRMLGR